MTTEATKLPEFIFGKLSTSEGRIERVKIMQSGLNQQLFLHPLDPQENEPITITVTVGSEIAVKTITLYYTTDGKTPQITEKNDDSSTITLPMQKNSIEWNTLQWSYLEKWTVVIPGQPKNTQVKYAIAALTTTDEIIYCPHLTSEKFDNANSKKILRFKPKNQPQIYSFYVDNETIPTWFREAIIYQIFVERFAPTPGEKWNKTTDLSDFFGGTIPGIIAKLDYLKNLGVNCLWLTPIFSSTSHHGYDPISHSEIEPRLGTEKDWEVLVKEANKRGIKIILDYVANHFSDQHEKFKLAQKNPESEAYKWFRFQPETQEYECFFDVPTQPEVNSENPEVRQYLIDNACYWLKKGCHGFRLDYAHGLSQAFWSEFRNATRQIKSDSITLGEVTEPPDFLLSFAGRMDGCLDFKVLELFRVFFGFNTLTVAEFDQQLNQHFSYFGNNLVLPSFLDNHDMNRFLWVVNGDKRRLKIAALCQFTLPNPPIIYYGTEVGLSQLKEVGRLEESRLPMLWENEQDQDILLFYQKLIKWRKTHINLVKKARRSLIIDEEKRVYVYSFIASEGSNFVIALNNSPESVEVKINKGENGDLILKTDPQINWNPAKDSLQLSAYGGVIMQVIK